MEPADRRCLEAAATVNGNNAGHDHAGSKASTSGSAKRWARHPTDSPMATVSHMLRCRRTATASEIITALAFKAILNDMIQHIMIRKRIVRANF